jgi:hypothetical protein
MDALAKVLEPRCYTPPTTHAAIAMTQCLSNLQAEAALKGSLHPAVVVPPINFSMVAPGIYRSGHPNKKNSGFLRGLALKGIMYAGSSCA